jgi:hypothetical protein
VLLTKRGTNELHVSLYEYNRNTATFADTWFNNQAGVPVQQLVRNQFGASIGGPIMKDRLFCCANWEQRIDAGLNVRVNHNNLSSFTSSYPLYACGATELIGLGEDIDNSVSAYLGNAQLANPAAVTNASAMLLGILNDVFVTYRYNKNGQVLPQGTPAAKVVHREFLQRLRGRRLACEPATHSEPRAALRELPAAL